MSDLYDTDIVAWAEHQAALLRRMAAGEHVNNQVDWENVAEEIEDVGKRDRNDLYGRLVTACLHLLRWQFQSAMRSNHWRSAVVKARSRIAKLIRDNPTLHSYPATILADAYRDARRAAAAEIGIALDDLPAKRPWPLDLVLDFEFFPD